eukprot:GHVU01012857.1.p1 GENE.GHVU01012857.1~~GHVU01012857.1.p1  ORF type:complete len:433 (-),score=100.86 GHVU01012857.1:537-1784(-)
MKARLLAATTRLFHVIRLGLDVLIGVGNHFGDGPLEIKAHHRKWADALLQGDSGRQLNPLLSAACVGVFLSAHQSLDVGKKLLTDTGMALDMEEFEDESQRRGEQQHLISPKGANDAAEEVSLWALRWIAKYEGHMRHYILDLEPYSSILLTCPPPSTGSSGKGSAAAALTAAAVAAAVVNVRSLNKRVHSNVHLLDTLTSRCLKWASIAVEAASLKDYLPLSVCRTFTDAIVFFYRSALPLTRLLLANLDIVTAIRSKLQQPHHASKRTAGRKENREGSVQAPQVISEAVLRLAAQLCALKPQVECFVHTIEDRSNVAKQKFGGSRLLQEIVFHLEATDGLLLSHSSTRAVLRDKGKRSRARDFSIDGNRITDLLEEQAANAASRLTEEATPEEVPAEAPEPVREAKVEPMDQD